MPSILDDKLLSLRLAAQPEFRLRLVEFLHSYGVLEHSALVAQARPAHGSVLVSVNVDDTDVQTRFLAGIPTNNGWWKGFRSTVAARHTFQGIASMPSREEPTWAAEVHRDGHFIAGIWKFPELTAQGEAVQVMADFYVDIFNDFLRLVESTLEGVSKQPIYDATWTLVQAPKLHYGSRSNWGRQFAITASPLQISNLQWPISTAQVGTPGWKQLAVRMGQALTGAYGDVPPSAQ